MAVSASRTTGGRTLGDYLTVLWRWKWMIVAIVVASTGGAYLYAWSQSPQYSSAATLLYEQPVDPTNPLQTSYYSSMDRDMAVESVINIMGSTEIADRAEKYLGDEVDDPYNVSASTRTSSDATSSGSGGVVDIVATSGNPRESAKVATVYAQAVVEWRKAQQVDRVEVAIEAVEQALTTYNTEASRQSAEYLSLKQQLANLELLKTTSSADFKMVSPGMVPTEPFAPKPLKSAMLGMGVGLLIGVGLAFLLDPLTQRVRGKREAGEVLGLPILGSVPEIERDKLRHGNIVALTDPSGRSAEALRLIRSNLDYLNVDRASSILVTSALAGEGKSTTACNLAVTMALAGKHVAIVDGDLRRPKIHEYFGLSNATGLSSVAFGDAQLRDALLEVSLAPRRPGSDGSGAIVRQRAAMDRAGGKPAAGAVTTAATATPRVLERAAGDMRKLLVLPAGPRVADPGEVVASRRFGEVIRELQSDDVDVVIVDTPALLEVSDAAAMASQVEALIVIVDITKAHQMVLQEMRDILAPLPCKQLGAILVKTKRSRSSGYGYYSDV